MTHRDNEAMPDLSTLYLAVRRELAEELAIHDTSPTHPDRCLCGGWDGQDTYWDHLADAALSVMYGDPS